METQQTQINQHSKTDVIKRPHPNPSQPELNDCNNRIDINSSQMMNKLQN